MIKYIEEKAKEKKTTITITTALHTHTYIHIYTNTDTDTTFWANILSYYPSPMFSVQISFCSYYSFSLCLLRKAQEKRISRSWGGKKRHIMRLRISCRHNCMTHSKKKPLVAACKIKYISANRRSNIVQNMRTITVSVSVFAMGSLLWASTLTSERVRIFAFMLFYSIHCVN